jgi:phage terminase large subunit-like protein
MTSFDVFCRLIGLKLEAYERRIIRASSARELLVIIGRGNGKSSLIAAYALWHLVTKPGDVVIAASSRSQAAIAYRFAQEFARELQHPNIVDRHLELRFCPDSAKPREFSRHLQVLSADAGKAHGLVFDLAIVDELHVHKDADLYMAVLTGLAKRPGARMITISTAAGSHDSPLGALRARCLAQPSVRRTGARLEAKGPDTRLIEWSMPDEWPLTARNAKRCNPASWLTVQALRSQLEAMPENVFRRYHLCQWVTAEKAWLPAGALQACQHPGGAVEGRVWIGVDLDHQGERGSVAWTDGHHAGVWTGTGAAAVDLVRELAADHHVVEIVLDRWRCQPLLAELEELGAPVVAFPLTDSRLIPASARLHDAIVGGKLVLPESEELRAASARTTARQVRRGWRIDGPDTGLIIALAMALDASAVEEPEGTTIVGWI